VGRRGTIADATGRERRDHGMTASAPRRGAGGYRAPRRLVFCLAALALLLAHQAFAVGDRRDGASEDPVFAGAVASGLLAPRADVVGAAPALPDAVAGPVAPGLPAAFRHACPAHQGTIPVPMPGSDDVSPTAPRPGAADGAAPPPRADDPRRRRALFQVFRN
jgi:hypothetical protein